MIQFLDSVVFGGEFQAVCEAGDQFFRLSDETYDFGGDFECRPFIKARLI